MYLQVKVEKSVRDRSGIEAADWFDNSKKSLDIHHMNWTLLLPVIDARIIIIFYLA